MRGVPLLQIVWNSYVSTLHVSLGHHKALAPLFSWSWQMFNFELLLWMCKISWLELSNVFLSLGAILIQIASCFFLLFKTFLNKWWNSCSRWRHSTMIRSAWVMFTYFKTSLSIIVLQRVVAFVSTRTFQDIRKLSLRLWQAKKLLLTDMALLLFQIKFLHHNLSLKDPVLSEKLKFWSEVFVQSFCSCSKWRGGEEKEARNSNDIRSGLLRHF